MWYKFSFMFLGKYSLCGGVKVNAVDIPGKGSGDEARSKRKSLIADPVNGCILLLLELGVDDDGGLFSWRISFKDNTTRLLSSSSSRSSSSSCSSSSSSKSPVFVKSSCRVRSFFSLFRSLSRRLEALNNRDGSMIFEAEVTMEGDSSSKLERLSTSELSSEASIIPKSSGEAAGVGVCSGIELSTKPRICNDSPASIKI
uniref:Uncharacterized protein n=1 Tax=Glossina austeni TaxID=7395 RepID=A0A1A9VVP0_GLOAU